MKFKIGIATRIAIFIALIIGGYYIYQQKTTQSKGPVIERALQGVAKENIAPAPEFIIKQSIELKLSDAQLNKLQAIAAAYRKEITPYQQKIRAESFKYEKKMKELREKNASVNEITSAYNNISRLSSIISTTRQSYWQQAKKVLNESQQKLLDGLIIKKATVGDLQ
jgi:hypothetical protein